MGVRHTVESPIKLSREVLGQCSKRAQRQGIIAGLVAGFLGGITGKRILRFDRSKTLLSGVLTCVCSGYFFTQAFLGTRIAEAVVQETQLRRKASSPELMPDESLQDHDAEERFA